MNERKECRYCLSGDEPEKLIDPCICEGTMRYVHKDCLVEWIKNGNRQTYNSFNEGKMKFYVAICEICKYQMKYTKLFKHNYLLSLLKLLKKIFCSLKETGMLVFHMAILYLLINRLKLFFNECVKTFKKSFISINPSAMVNLAHNIIVVLSILCGIYDLYNYYKKMLDVERKCEVKFLPKSKSV
jgi:E3 ubiquitin-protein ligase DOA10